MDTNDRFNSTATPGRLRDAGRWWRMWGIVLVFLGIVFLTPLQLMQSNPDQTDWTTLLVAGTLAVASTFGGFGCFVRGKKLRAVTAQELTARDQRPPVVYLRSFKDDAAAATNPFISLLGIASFVYGMATEEEQLAEAFNELGPFIAIGKPGEKLPQTGAARMYAKDTEWQDRVEDLMRNAQLVVLRIGKTPGFWWEVQRAVELVGPTRIIFFVPFGKKRYDEFRRRIETMLPCQLPALPSGHSLSLGPLRAMIYFGPDWTPRVAMLKARWSMSLNPLAPVLRNSLQPVARQLQLEMHGQAAPKSSVLGRSLRTIPGVVTLTLLCSFLAGFGIQLLGTTLNNVGLRSYYRGDLDDAIRELRVATQLSPGLAAPYNNIGLALYARHDLDAAIGEYRVALRLDPVLANAHSNLCLALYDKGSVDEGLGECREAIRLDPRNALAHNNLGLGLLRKGDRAALQEFQTAYDLAPDNVTVRKNHEWALQLQRTLRG